MLLKLYIIGFLFVLHHFIYISTLNRDKETEYLIKNTSNFAKFIVAFLLILTMLVYPISIPILLIIRKVRKNKLN